MTVTVQAEHEDGTRVEVLTFRRERRKLRAVVIDAEPWFVAKDVCDLTGAPFMPTVSNADPEDRLGLDRRYFERGKSYLHATGDFVWFMSEPLLYDMSAQYCGRDLQRWVCRDVLRSIRQLDTVSARSEDLPLVVERRFVAVRNIKEPPRHVLYRLYDSDGELLYVGLTNRITARLSEHEWHKPWWHAVTTVHVEHFPNRARAAEAEIAAIRSEQPRYNITYRRAG